MNLDLYHTMELIATPWGRLASKRGVKSFPRLHPALMLLLRTIPLQAFQGKHLIDITDSGGLGLLTDAATVTVAGTSRAALNCALHNRTYPFIKHKDARVIPAASWQLEPASADVMIQIPHTDKGTERVRDDLQGAANTLRVDGCVYLVMHKDQGAKRYEKMAATIFGSVDILAKDGGWRLSRCTKVKDAYQPVTPKTFSARGFDLQAFSGVFAAGKLDKGSAFLIETLEAAGTLSKYQGKRILDIGCGYGILTLEMARVGATVTALDDDLLAVQSTQENVRTAGLEAHCLHSDVDSVLHSHNQGCSEDERLQYDAVVMNPPFHLGKQVRLDIPLAFIEAARRYLDPEGSLILVANADLPYENHLGKWGNWQHIAENQGFKILGASC